MILQSNYQVLQKHYSQLQEEKGATPEATPEATATERAPERATPPTAILHTNNATARESVKAVTNAAPPAPPEQQEINDEIVSFSSSSSPPRLPVLELERSLPPTPIQEDEEVLDGTTCVETPVQQHDNSWDSKVVDILLGSTGTPIQEEEEEDDDEEEQEE